MIWSSVIFFLGIAFILFKLIRVSSGGSSVLDELDFDNPSPAGIVAFFCLLVGTPAFLWHLMKSRSLQITIPKSTGDHTPLPENQRLKPVYPVPAGFTNGHRHLKPNTRVFHPNEGEGVVIGTGVDRHFVRVRFDVDNVEKAMETYGLYTTP